MENQNKEISVIAWTNLGNRKFFRMEDSPIPFDVAKAAVLKELKQKGYRFSGFYHQFADRGVPVLTGGYRFELSYKDWGFLMTEAQGGDPTRWAWGTPDPRTEVYPH